MKNKTAGIPWLKDNQKLGLKRIVIKKFKQCESKLEGCFMKSWQWHMRPWVVNAKPSCCCFIRLCVDAIYRHRCWPDIFHRRILNQKGDPPSFYQLPKQYISSLNSALKDCLLRSSYVIYFQSPPKKESGSIQCWNQMCSEFKENKVKDVILFDFFHTFTLTREM